MNNGISGAYEAPQVEIIEVAVEQGFDFVEATTLTVQFCE